MASTAVRLRQSFRQHARVIVTGESQNQVLQQPAELAPQDKRGSPPTCTAQETANTSISATVVAVQGYLGDATLLEIQRTVAPAGQLALPGLRNSTSDSPPSLAIYATRLGRRVFSCTTAYQVSLAFWVTLSFMGWCVVTVTALFTLIFQAFAWQTSQTPSPGASTLGLLAAAVPIMLYLLSLVAFHVFLLEDVLLNLAHASQLVLYTLDSCCCLHSTRSQRRLIPTIMSTAAIMLGAFVLVLNSALVAAVASGSRDSSRFLAECITALMAVLALWHLLCLGCLPCIRYRNSHSGESQARQCADELWLRAGLVCSNTLWSTLSCSCLCFKNQPDISNQAKYVRKQLLVWKAPRLHSVRAPSSGTPGLPPLPPHPPFISPRSTASCSPLPVSDVVVSPSLVSASSNPASGQHRSGRHSMAGAEAKQSVESTSELDSVQALFQQGSEPNEDLSADSDSSTGARSLPSLSSSEGFSPSVNSTRGPALTGDAWAATPPLQPLTSTQSEGRGTLQQNSLSQSESKTSVSISVGDTSSTGRTRLMRSASFRSATASQLTRPSSAGGSSEGRSARSHRSLSSTSQQPLPGLSLPSAVMLLCHSRARPQGSGRPDRCLLPSLARSAAKLATCWIISTIIAAFSSNRAILLSGIAVGFPVSALVWLLAASLQGLSHFSHRLPACCAPCCIHDAHFKNVVSIHVSSFRSALVPGVVGLVAASARAGLSGAIATSVGQLNAAGLVFAAIALAIVAATRWWNLVSLYSDRASGDCTGKLFRGVCLLDEMGDLQQLACCRSASHQLSDPPTVSLGSISSKWFWHSLAFFLVLTLFVAAGLPLVVFSPHLTVLLVLSTSALGVFSINGLPTHGASLKHLANGGQSGAAGLGSRPLSPVSANMAARPRFTPAADQHQAPGSSTPILIEEDSRAYDAYGAPNSDSISTVLFAEKQLRWSFVLPLFLLALVAGMITTVLLDSGVNSPLETVVAWRDSSPIQPSSAGTLRPGLCEQTAGGLGVLDLALLSRIIYLASDETEYRKVLGTFFPGRSHDVVLISPEQVNKPVFSVLTIGQAAGAHVATANTTVISVRGSLQGFDWAQSLYTWGPSMMAQAVQYVLPLLRPLRYAETDELLLGRMAQIETVGSSSRYNSIQPFYVPITRVATALQRATRSADPMPLRDALQSVNVDADDIAAYNMSAPLGSSLVLTGHSLGGGVAMIAGASADVAAVSYSGPGPVLGRERYQRSIDAACPECDADLSAARLHRSVLNIAPTGDFVPWAGGQPRSTQSLECEGSFAECHTISRSICKLIAQCGDAYGRSFVDIKSDPSSLDIQRCCIGGIFGGSHSDCTKLVCTHKNNGKVLPSELAGLCYS